jgi:glycosyltransferase involved in cell wall biosynthesis
MRILFTCGREPAYPRNAVIRQILRQSHDVIEITDSSRHLPVRYTRLALRLLLSRQPYDLAFVGFLGHPLMLLVPFLARRPILFDIHISVYDTLCLDRRWFSPHSMVGRLAFWLDTVASQRASHILIDTRTHANYLCQTFGIPPDKITPLFVGCNEQIFYPRQPLQAARSTVTVLHYGSHLPLHGLDTILRAAERLDSSSNIRFKIIGSGIHTQSTRQLARQLNLRNVDWLPFIPTTQLPGEIQAADICLGGHFSAIPKAARVIAGKTFECIAMGKPTIVGENPANHELLTHGYDAYFCPMADPVALAESILILAQDADLRDHLGHNARQTFLAHCSTAVLGQSLNDLIARLAGERASTSS